MIRSDLKWCGGRGTWLYFILYYTHRATMNGVYFLEEALSPDINCSRFKDVGGY